MVAWLWDPRGAANGTVTAEASDLELPATLARYACMSLPLRRGRRTKEIVWRLDLRGVHVNRGSCRAVREPEVQSRHSDWTVVLLSQLSGR